MTTQNNEMATDNNNIYNQMLALAKKPVADIAIQNDDINAEENPAKKVLAILGQANALNLTAVELAKVTIGIFTSCVDVVEKGWRLQYKKWMGENAEAWKMVDGLPVSDVKQQEQDSIDDTAFHASFNRFQAAMTKYYNFETCGLRSDAEIEIMNEKKRGTKSKKTQAGETDLKKQMAAKDELHVKAISELEKKHTETMEQAQKNGQELFNTQQQRIKELELQLAAKESELVAAQSASGVNLESVSEFLTSSAFTATDSKVKGSKAFQSNVTKVISFMVG